MLLQKRAGLRAEERFPLQRIAQAAQGEHVVVEGLEREALPLLRLHVLPHLHQDQLAKGIYPITRVEGATLGFFPGAALFQESRLAEILAGLQTKALESVGVPAAGKKAAGAAPPLTSRETEVLHHVAAGLQNKEVAQKLGLSVATIRNHIHNILEKLGVHSKLEAVSLSFRNGWVLRGDDAARPAALPSRVPDEI